MVEGGVCDIQEALNKANRRDQNKYRGPFQTLIESQSFEGCWTDPLSLSKVPSQRYPGFIPAHESIGITKKQLCSVPEAIASKVSSPEFEERAWLTVLALAIF